MTNPEFFSLNNDPSLADERDELIDRYLVERDSSYEELVEKLAEYDGCVAFHDSEQLDRLCATYPAGTKVEFSEQVTPGGFQLGIIVEDTFMVPFANSHRERNLYRPYLCATIQNTDGVVDTLLLPVSKRSDGRFEVLGLRLLPEHTS